MATANSADMKKKIERQQKKAARRARIGGFDMTFLILLLVVLAVGLVCMFSASYVYAYYYNKKDSYYYIRRQMIFALIGVAAMLICSCFDYHIWHRLALPVAAVSVILLIVVRLLPAIKGVHRWIQIAGFQFQPSEIAKFALILLFAHLISLNQKRMDTFKAGFLPFFLIMILVCGLVVIEPHLSGTILLFAIGMVMMFVGGTKLRYLLGLLGIGGIGAYIVVFIMGYELDRVQVWQDPFSAYKGELFDKAWQTVQSLYAIGSGGLLGQGPGNSRQKHLFLPEPQNDFVFAVVCEELGFIGAVFIILLFAALVWRGFYVGMRAPDKFGFLLAVGLTAQIGLQVAFNLAVVSNLVPNTGISLPFFSYGGSSLVMLLGQMGIVLSISRQSRGRVLT